jgi:polysaccharide pyruvyl transferase WcaK-like protein
MNYVIVGPALSGNMGAASMVLATVDGLRRRDPEARITLLSYYPTEDRAVARGTDLEVLDARPVRLGTAINPGAVVWRLVPPLRRWIARVVPEVAALAAADVVLDQGGIAFSDGREKFLVFNLAILTPGFFLGRPIVKCAQALGPFRRRLNRIAARVALPRVGLVIARGEATKAFCDELGLDNTELGTDLAFTLGRPDPVAATRRPRVAEADVRLMSPGLVVGIAPSVVVRDQVESAGGDFVALMADEIERHLARGRRVLLVPHSFRDDPAKVHNNDGPLVAAIAARIDHPDLVVVNERLDADELRHLIGRCDVFVSCRFHAMVSALSMGVPTLVVGWSHKYVEVLERFDQADRSIDARHLDARGLGEATERLITDRARIADQIATAQHGVTELAGRQLDRIVQIGHTR